MSVAQITAERAIAIPQPRRESSWMWLVRLRRHRLAFSGMVILGVMTVVGLFAPLIARFDPYEIHATDRLSAPGPIYWLGADSLGRDVFSRLVHGARISLSVGAATVTACGLLGIIIGLVAGYYRRFDNILMRVMDAFMSFPSILLALGIMAVLGPDIRNIVMALAIVYVPRIARVVRSAVLGLREADYVLACRTIGVRDLRILLRHVLPNCMAPIIVQLTFTFAYAVIAEASLSFLGVGSSPEVPSWGNMLNDARRFLQRAPLLAIFPGVAIMLTVLSLNLLGDGLRDVLDPHLKDRGAG
jgi:peptide/nickel transport system permease protein